MAFFTNKTDGPRGIQTKNGLVLIEGGATSDDLDVADADAKLVTDAGWFDQSKAAPKKTDDAPAADAKT